MAELVDLDKITSLCKRRGFVFASAEIYGGLNGVYDFGPLGCLLKQNLKKLWLSQMSSYPQDVVQLDGAILGHEKIWQASGHVANFSDPMVDCLQCKKRFRADELDLEKPCPSCGIKNWTEARQFMLMFQTQVGAMAGQGSIAYLRPETAQMVFANFKNVTTSSRVKPPFGIAQIGKAFRNEITPKQFLFRMREFEQMELEFFCHPDESDQIFTTWQERRMQFYKTIGLNTDKVRLRPHSNDELAHYSKACCDVEYQFPFGWKELEGIAHRGDFDLTCHQNTAGKELAYFDQATGQKYLPHVVECSVGVERLFLTLLFDAYHEEELEGETRVVLRLAPKVAPIQLAVLPLVKKLESGANELFTSLKTAGWSVQYDDSGSIGKRYRRQDEIGTPFCLTYDFQSVEDRTVTIRDRDSLEQERVSLDKLQEVLKYKMETWMPRK